MESLNYSISPFASEYISLYATKIDMDSANEKLVYSANISACKTSDEIGIKGSILELRNGVWVSVDTFSTTVYSRATAFYSGFYTPVEGRTYKISVSFNVKIGNGGDSKSLDSLSCTVK